MFVRDPPGGKRGDRRRAIDRIRNPADRIRNPVTPIGPRYWKRDERQFLVTNGSKCRMNVHFGPESEGVSGVGRANAIHETRGQGDEITVSSV
jgi:hypothetical protein